MDDTNTDAPRTDIHDDAVERVFPLAAKTEHHLIIACACALLRV